MKQKHKHKQRVTGDARCGLGGSGFVDSTFLALGPPGVGVRAMNFSSPLSFHEGDRRHHR